MERRALVTSAPAANLPRHPLPLARCREILGSADMSEEQLAALRADLYALAQMIVGRFVLDRQRRAA